MDHTFNIEATDLKFNRFVESKHFTPDKGINILLIDPPGYQKGINVGLAYLAGALKKAGMMNVEVLDLNNVYAGLTEDKIGMLLTNRGYDIIGFSIKTPTYNTAMEVSKITKKYLPKAVHIAGGPHITLNFDEFMKEAPQFPYINIGEGEHSFVEFCKMIASAKEYPITGIMGRTSSDKVPAKNCFITNLDELAYPEFEVFNGFDFSNFEYLIVTSRGCPYKCTYCSVGMISGSKIRFRKIDSIAEELKWAKGKFNIKRFNVIDDNFTLDIRRAKEFCDRLIKDNMNLQWACGNGIRADRIDTELAGKMKKAGCNLVCVGVENADPKVFNAIKKGETLDDIKRGIALLKNAGIEVVGFFIIGLPGDSKRSSEMSLEFIKESRLDSARFGILLPYPKTGVFDWIEKNGTFLKDYKEGIHFSDIMEPVYETKEFSAKDMIETYNRLYTKLGCFTFLMPQTITKTEKLKRVVKLLWKYDKAGLIKTGIKMLKSHLPGI